MPLHKREGSPHWQIRFELNGKLYRKSSKTAERRLASAVEREFHDEAIREQQLNERRDTWDDAIKQWFLEKVHKKSLWRDRRIADFYTDLMPSPFVMARLTEHDVAGLRAATVGMAIPVAGKGGLPSTTRPPNPATVNRYLAWLQAFLRACESWHMVGSHYRIQKLTSARREYVLHGRPAVDSVLDALHPAARAAAVFALSTGMRRSNVFGLRWANVDLAGHAITVAGSEHKSGTAKRVPVSDDAVAILEAQAGKHSEYVFTDHKGHAPVKSIKTAWRTACKKAGVEGLRFHDLRHQWASAHVANGTPLLVVKELGGWASLAMVDRVYSHLAPSTLSTWAGNSGAKAT